MPRTHRPTSPAVLRARVWVERGGVVALTDAGADLLEQIGAKGSLSEAARSLHFSYRRAWMLLDAMNKRWDQPLVVTAVGGKRGGGAMLTELGGRVLRSFRDLQLHIEAAIDQEAEGFRRATRIP
jgi:molybdate transport system regulatory protein